MPTRADQSQEKATQTRIIRWYQQPYSSIAILTWSTDGVLSLDTVVSLLTSCRVTEPQPFAYPHHLYQDHKWCALGATAGCAPEGAGVWPDMDLAAPSRQHEKAVSLLTFKTCNPLKLTQHFTYLKGRLNLEAKVARAAALPHLSPPP
jgi:hypothetical protein